MGYALATSTCFGCRRLFSYNPVRVPSIRDPDTGTKEPVCFSCITRANVQRKAKGFAPLVPHSMAYEPCDEDELS